MAKRRNLSRHSARSRNSNEQQYLEDIHLAAEFARVDLVEELAQHERVEHHGVVYRGHLPCGLAARVAPNSGAGVQDKEDGRNLVDRVHDDEPPHAPGDERLVAPVRLAVQELVGRFLC